MPFPHEIWHDPAAAAAAAAPPETATISVPCETGSTPSLVTRGAVAAEPRVEGGMPPSSSSGCTVVEWIP